MPFLFLFLPPATCQKRVVPLNSSPLRNRTPLQYHQVSMQVCMVVCDFTPGQRGEARLAQYYDGRVLA